MKKRFKFVLAITAAIIITTSSPFEVKAQHIGTDYPAGIPINFVRTWDAAAPETDPNNLMTLPLRDVKQATQYFDGLGRPLQTVIKQGSLITGGTATDMVSPTEYDVFGREQYKWLPFASTENTGTFKTNPFTQQLTFYNDPNGVLKSQGENYFYSQTVFEASPLNRVTKSMAPGVSWAGAGNGGRGTEQKYWVNTTTDNVKIWNVTDMAGSFGTYAIATLNSGAYNAGELYKNISVDEHGKQVVEFKDKEGKIILKKVQLTAVADDGNGSGYANWLCTYYIYDDLNNLRCVIQPEGVNKLADPAINWQLSNNPTLLNDQCFRYEYDSRNRMIMKKVPGAGEVYMVYDTRDRLVLTQDANMRVGTVKWMYTQYDELNRLVATGLWPSALTWAEHSAVANNSTSYPSNMSGQEELTRTFYDNYIWADGISANVNPFGATRSTLDDANFNAPGTTYPYYQALTQSNALKGMVTGSRVKVLGTSTYLYSISYYDDKGRVIQSQMQNITSGTDINTTQYNWAGQPMMNVLRQQKGGATNPQAHIVITKMQYDDLGRVLNVKKTVNSTINAVAVTKPEQLIVQNEYNALGQLKKKTLGANNLENLTYDYNIRGWMLGANRDYAKDANSTNYFGFDLGYDKANNNIIGSQTYNNPQYNGNIEGMVWKSKGDGEKRKYDFTYDAANRLTGADFNQYTSSTFSKTAGFDFSVSNLTFDANGNILTMNQKGWKIGGSVMIDQMTYSYFTNTNKLKAVTDAVTADNKLGDFTDKNTTATDYGYDKNGNLVTDLNKQMGSTTGVDITTGGAITYNHLNLPQVITVTDKGTITYTYDAAGNKIKKQTLENPTTANGNKTITTITTYIGGMVYESKTITPADANNPNYTDRLLFIGHEEGRIRFKPVVGSTPASFQYDYMLKDHLGNIRMVLTEEQQQDIYPATTLENATYNGGTAVTKETEYYNITPANIVTQATATGIPVYQNNNGITNNNPYSNTTANSTRLYRLDATTNTVPNKTGLGIVLKVMAGDNLNIFGKSYHKKPSAGYTLATNPLTLTNIIDLFTGTSLITGKGVSTTQITGQSGFPANVTTMLNNQPVQNTNMPRAGINWIIFDEQFKYVSGGFDMVGTATNTTGTFKNHVPGIITIPKNGYIYVYCSNESKYPVFFDNIQVVHNRSAILEETHYYPFGLTMAGISSKAAGSLENKRKWNAGSELASKEFSDGSGLELYETDFRSLDPQIGRFWKIDPMSDEQEQYSPFSYANNNPILLNDPLGLIPETSTPDKPKDLQEVVVVGSRNKSKASSFSWINFAPTGMPPITAPPFGGTGTGTGTGVGTHSLIWAAVWARTSVKDLARRLENKRFYVTYTKRGPNGQIYVGRCSGYGNTAEEVLKRRDANHTELKARGYSEAVIDQQISGSVFAKIENATGRSVPFGVDAGTEIVTSEISGYAATRGREQQLYASYKNAGYTMANSINPVWKYNPAAPAYFVASTVAFGPLVSYDDLYR